MGGCGSFDDVAGSLSAAVASVFLLACRLEAVSDLRLALRLAVLSKD